jgi:DNA polymerase-3 subunit gamma/tau
LQGESLNYGYVIKLISVFSELISQMKYSSNPRILLEVCCIKACNPVTESDASSLEMRIKALEKTISEQSEKLSAMPAQTAQPVVQYVPAPAESNTVTEEVMPVSMMRKIIPDEVKEVIDLWKDFLNAEYKQSIKRTVLSEHCTAAYLENEFVNIVCEDAYLTATEKYKEELHEKLSRYFGRNIPVQVMTKTQHNRRHRELHGADDPDIKKRGDINQVIDFFGSDLDVTD